MKAQKPNCNKIWCCVKEKQNINITKFYTEIIALFYFNWENYTCLYLL